MSLHLPLSLSFLTHSSPPPLLPLCSDHREVSRTAEIAEALQNRLDAYKAEKRELGSVSGTTLYSIYRIGSSAPMPCGMYCSLFRLPRSPSHS